MEFEQLGLGNDVIEFDVMGLGEDDTVDLGQTVEEDEEKLLLDTSYGGYGGAAAAPGGGKIYVLEGDKNLEPYDGMEYESEEAAKVFYNSYAWCVGFSTRVSMFRRSRRDGAIFRDLLFVLRKDFVLRKNGRKGITLGLSGHDLKQGLAVKQYWWSKFKIPENGLFLDL